MMWGKAKEIVGNLVFLLLPVSLKTKIWYTEKSQMKDKHSIKPEVLNLNIYIHTKMSVYFLSVSTGNA